MNNFTLRGFAILLAVLAVLAVVLLGWSLLRILFQRGNNLPTAETITIVDLKTHLKKLADGQAENEFIGITSNGIDCLYFTVENQLFNIEFEAISEEQLPFLNRLKEYAKTRGLDSELTTYGNSPHYKSADPAPVLRININAGLDEADEIGRDIQSKIFGNPPEAAYDVVP